MNPRKLIGIVFLSAGTAGILICIAAIIAVWGLRPGLERSLLDNFSLAADALDATMDGLTAAGQIVGTTTDNVVLIQTTVHTTTLTMSNTGLVLDSLVTITGEDLPSTIRATQISLVSAQNTALLIDDVLGALTGIPFLGLGIYQPEVPLNTAIAEISASLDPLPASFVEVSEGLEGAAGNLEDLQTELTRISATSDGIVIALNDAETVILEYQAVITALKEKVDAGQETLPSRTRIGALVASLLLLNLLFTQVALAEHGISILREKRETPAG